jgi:MFS transporter, DHA1 family, inner membrane transport protein
VTVAESTPAVVAEGSVPVAGYRSPIVALCVVSFVATLLFGALGPFLSKIADDLDSSVPAIGQGATIRLIISAALGLVAGPVADRYGYRRLLAAGMIGAAVSFAMTGLAPTYPLFLLASVPSGLAGAVLFGLPLAYAANRYDGDERRRAIGWIVASLSGSAVVGVPILTTIERFTGWRAVFLICAGLSAAAAGFVVRSLPYDFTRPEKRFARGELVVAYRPLIAARRMVLFIGSTVARGIGWLGFLTYVGAYLDDDVGLSTQQVGLAYFVGGSCYFVGSVAAGRGWVRAPLPAIAAAMTLSMGILVLVSLLVASNAVIAVVAIGVVTFSGALAWVSLTTFLSAVTPAGQGTTMTLNSTMQSLGAALGGAYGGGLIALGGYELLGFGLSAVLGIAALLVFAASASKPTSL